MDQSTTCQEAEREEGAACTFSLGNSRKQEGGPRWPPSFFALLIPTAHCSQRSSVSVLRIWPSEALSQTYLVVLFSPSVLIMTRW